MDRYFIRDVIRLVKKKGERKNKAVAQPVEQPVAQHNDAFFSGILHPSAFVHSGTLCDIIYSLLFIQQHSDKKTILYILKDSQEIAGDLYIKTHIGGGKMMTQQMFNFIKPLIIAQPYIRDVIFEAEACINYNTTTNLDYFRHCKINTSAGEIRDWYGKAFGVSLDITPKFLFVDKSQKYDFLENAILISRTQRYNNDAIDYSILNNFENVYFMGLENEFNVFAEQFKLDKIKHISIDNALDAAFAINSCKVFIANQTFFMAIAEGLKKPNRCLEVFELTPNVLPIGSQTLAFLKTEHLHRYIESIFNS